MTEQKMINAQLVKFKKNLGKALKGDRELYEVPIQVIRESLDVNEKTLKEIERGTYNGSVDTLFQLIILYDRYFKKKFKRRYKLPFHKSREEEIILKASLNRVYQVLSD